MYSVLTLMIVNALPRANLHLFKISSTCTLLSLHTAPTTFTTIATMSSAKNMVHGDSCLTSSVSLRPSQPQPKKGSEPNIGAILHQHKHYPSYPVLAWPVSRYPMSSTTFTYFSSLFFLLYVLRLNPNDFQSSPQSIPPPIQGFLHLLTAAATTTTTVSSAKNMVLGDSCLTSSVSLSITTANKKGIRADPWCNPKAIPT